MTPRRHRKDANHDLIRDVVEARGWCFEDTSQTELGYDALVSKGDRTVRLEIKDGSKKPSAQRLTPNEETAHARFAAHGIPIELIRCVEDLQILERPQRARRDG